MSASSPMEEVPPARRRRRLLGMAAAAVLVAAVVPLVVRQPWQTVTKLPAHACWGVLTADDLRPLAAKGGGTMTAETSTSTLQPTTQAPKDGYLCKLTWHGGQVAHYLAFGPRIDLYTASELRQDQELDALGKVQPLSFGAGNVAWQAVGTIDTLNLAIPCAIRDLSSGQLSDGYARVRMDAAPDISGAPAPPSDVRQAEAGIVLKLAKALAQQYPCSGDTLPTLAPSIPPYPDRY